MIKQKDCIEKISFQDESKFFNLLEQGPKIPIFLTLNATIFQFA